MAVSNQLKNQHLFWRAGFGVAAQDIEKLSSVSPAKMYEAITKASAQKPEYLDVAKNIFDGLAKGVGEVITMESFQKQMQDEKTKKAFQQKSREGIKSLNLTWLDEMVATNAQLREKMSFFWHGHFACRQLNIYFQQLLLDDIRRNALGSFRDLLVGVSKSAAMLSFLNNQQNKKQHPNENFAREVMELFTMGRGNYTEKDIKEAARAFTGWGFNMQGEFVARPFQHDNGNKTFLGKTGNFDGDDILNIILEQKQTARHITQKIYSFFVNEKVDNDKVNWLADRFFKSDYNIHGLMDDIFASDWFYDSKNIGSKIKSPIELLAGIRRIVPMDIQNDEVQLLMQRALGQMLFYPPNVAGWPGGKTWIDSSSLMLRLRIPQLIKGNEDLSLNAKADDDQTMGMREQNFARKGFKEMPGNKKFRLDASVDWASFIKQFAKVHREKLYGSMESLLLQTQVGSVNNKAVEKVIDSSNRDSYIQSTAIALMCTPEYQLC